MDITVIIACGIVGFVFTLLAATVWWASDQAGEYDKEYFSIWIAFGSVGVALFGVFLVASLLLLIGVLL